MKPLALTLGDPAGIGPEIALRVASEREDVLLVGPGNLIALAASRLGLSLPPSRVVDIGASDESLLFCGRDEAAAGAASHAAVERAVRMTLAGDAAAVVTAPISKKAWRLAGFDDPGHTEFIGALTGGDPVMGFVGKESDGSVLRVALVTIHEPLARVPALITVERIVSAVCVAGRDLKTRFGLNSPRIAVAGVNPHAGESGAIGREDRDVVAPAVRILREEAWDVEGPLPGDAVFTPRSRHRFDLIFAMYHDQGLAPFKALTAGSGVNVTLGLSIVRTSPDHGTAFDIAGRGTADSSSMRCAVELARTLADR